jgi:hypothetical protein
MSATRQQPNAAHTNPRVLNPNTIDHSAVYRALTADRGKYNASEQELHEHYASNARACGHADDCLKVTLPVNWPTLWGKPLCTCGRGEPWIHPRDRAAIAI